MLPGLKRTVSLHDFASACGGALPITKRARVPIAIPPSQASPTDIAGDPSCSSIDGGSDSLSVGRWIYTQ